MNALSTQTTDERQPAKCEMARMIMIDRQSFSFVLVLFSLNTKGDLIRCSGCYESLLSSSSVSPKSHQIIETSWNSIGHLKAPIHRIIALRPFRNWNNSVRRFEASRMHMNLTGESSWRSSHNYRHKDEIQPKFVLHLALPLLSTCCDGLCHVFRSVIITTINESVQRCSSIENSTRSAIGEFKMNKFHLNGKQHYVCARYQIDINKWNNIYSNNLMNKLDVTQNESIESIAHITLAHSSSPTASSPTPRHHSMWWEWVRIASRSQNHCVWPIEPGNITCCSTYSVLNRYAKRQTK